MLSRFHLIQERHGQTDRQTDRIDISISRNKNATHFDQHSTKYNNAQLAYAWISITASQKYTQWQISVR